MAGLAAFTFGLIGGVGFAAFVFEPVVHDMRPTRRLRYQISDLLWLTATLQLPLVFLVWSLRRDDPRGAQNDWPRLVLGSLLMVMTVALWRMSLLVLQQRGVQSVWRRGALIVVVMPVAVCSILATTVAWMAVLGMVFAGEWHGRLIALAGGAVAVGCGCRLAFHWIFSAETALANPAGPDSGGSPFDDDGKPFDDAAPPT
ncbi:MAG: hypothetical protein CMJ58_20440 [Planctomycetaceae bacterium]|nr:hypothetical protein [Planctomycetaceae bacterium]